MNQKSLGFLFFSIFVLSSCSQGPVPITYGTDQCSYCRMTVTDSKFASEIINTKGKAFKYDAIECMVRAEEKVQNIRDKYVCIYLEPGRLMSADSATYLISAALPSPMGGNLSAYSSLEKANEMQKQKGGKILSYSALLTALSK